MEDRGSKIANDPFSFYPPSSILDPPSSILIPRSPYFMGEPAGVFSNWASSDFS
jgi:hypothetical protein